MRHFKRTLCLLAAVAAVAALGISALANTEASGFSDVPAGAWYAEAAAYVRERDLMNGINDTSFGPELTMTRAMLATVLYRADGSPLPSLNC